MNLTHTVALRTWGFVDLKKQQQIQSVFAKLEQKYKIDYTDSTCGLIGHTDPTVITGSCVYILYTLYIIQCII